VEVSVLVQEAASGKPLPDVPVEAWAYRADDPDWRTGAPATPEAAANKLFRAAELQLPEPGRYLVKVFVGDPWEGVWVEFEVEARAGPPPPWLELAPWVGWPAAAVLLFAAHAWLAGRRGTHVTRRPPAT